MNFTIILFYDFIEYNYDDMFILIESEGFNSYQVTKNPISPFLTLKF